MGMEGNFGLQSNGGYNRQPIFSPDEIEKRYRLSVNEIIGQLSNTTPKFDAELKKLKAGNDFDKDWLEDYKANLVDWMNDIKMVVGTIDRRNEEIYNEAKRRFYVISEEQELKKIKAKVLH